MIAYYFKEMAISCLQMFKHVFDTIVVVSTDKMVLLICQSTSATKWWRPALADLSDFKN